MDNTHRFSGNQPVSDITLLLWQLGSLCIDHMNTLLYGTDEKHGYLFRPIDRELYGQQRSALLHLMVDVCQELEISPDQVALAWKRVEQERKEGHAWGKEWVEDHG